MKLFQSETIIFFAVIMMKILEKVFNQFFVSYLNNDHNFYQYSLAIIS